jgi:predicted amidohydrolase YtcJ
MLGFITWGSSALLVLYSIAVSSAPDLIVHNADVTTFDDRKVTAFSVSDGKFERLGTDAEELLATRGADTVVIDARGRRVIPGINDSHLHVVRGGRFYNLETRWEGISSLKEALEMVRAQAERTPKGQWVRVVGGWSPYQFEEQRMPTLEELNEVAPDTPVFVLHLYSGGLLNKAGMEALGIDKNSKAPAGSRYERDADGNPTGRLIADPHPMILYKTIAALPQMSAEEQLNSSQQFYRKLLSLGITSAVDAGGGGHQFPEDYQASTTLAEKGELPIRVSNYLFPQEPGKELAQFKQWMGNYRPGEDRHIHFDDGFVVEGGGELLVWSASDYENFTSNRPDLKPQAEEELEAVLRLHLKRGWPFRIHATYNESIGRMLDVLEKVNETQPVSEVRWIIDHAETISDQNLQRIKALGGGIAVQGRMAFAGEHFLDRYGKEQTRRSPPIRKMLELGIPVGLGTDGTRVASFNPWVTYYWAVTGKTVGGTQLYGEDNTLDRETALRLFTKGSAWFSGEEKVKGSIAPGELADFVILNQDIFEVPAEKLPETAAEMTVVNGEVQYASDRYPQFAPPKTKAIPDWSPVNFD